MLRVKANPGKSTQVSSPHLQLSLTPTCKHLHPRAGTSSAHCGSSRQNSYDPMDYKFQYIAAIMTLLKWRWMGSSIYQHFYLIIIFLHFLLVFPILSNTLWAHLNSMPVTAASFQNTFPCVRKYKTVIESLVLIHWAVISMKVLMEEKFIHILF